MSSNAHRIPSWVKNSSYTGSASQYWKHMASTEPVLVASWAFGLTGLALPLFLRPMLVNDKHAEDKTKMERTITPQTGI